MHKRARQKSSGTSYLPQADVITCNSAEDTGGKEQQNELKFCLGTLLFALLCYLSRCKLNQRKVSNYFCLIQCITPLLIFLTDGTVKLKNRRENIIL